MADHEPRSAAASTARDFRDRLLAAGAPDPEFQTRLQQEIRQMVTRKLSMPSKLFLGLVGCAALVSSLVCGTLAATEPQLPPIARIGLGTGVLFGLGWIAAIVSILRRGELDLKRDGRRIAQMVWGFTLLMTVFFCLVGMSRPDRPVSVLIMVQSLVFLIGAAVYWLSHRIEEAELNVREKLLEIELRLAERTPAP